MNQNLRASVIALFDLYKQRGKSFFNLSLNFSLCFTLVSIILSVLIALIANDWYHYRHWQNDTTLWGVLTEHFIWRHLMELSTYLIIISFGLYAVYLKKRLNDTPGSQNPSFRDFGNTLTTKNWTNYLIATGLFCIIYLLSFKDLFDTENDGSGTIDLSRTLLGYDSVSKKINFYKWLNAIVELIKSYLPYLGALYIVLSDQHAKVDWALIRKYKTALLTIFVLGFLTNAISGNVIWFLDNYVKSLIDIPFKAQGGGAIFQFFVYILTGTWFCLAYSGVILFPVLNQQQQKNIIEDQVALSQPGTGSD